MRVTASSGIALFAILGFVGCAGSNIASTQTGGGNSVGGDTAQGGNPNGGAPGGGAAHTGGGNPQGTGGGTGGGNPQGTGGGNPQGTGGNQNVGGGALTGGRPATGGAPNAGGALTGGVANAGGNNPQAGGSPAGGSPGPTGGSPATGGTPTAACTDTPRSTESCADAKSYGFCGQSWFATYCNATCGTCSATISTGGSGNTNSGGRTGAGGTLGAGGNATGGARTGGGPATTGGGPAATGGSPGSSGSCNWTASSSTVSGQTGFGTRYWDCCMPSCSWSTQLPYCDANGTTTHSGTSSSTKSGCEGGSAFECFNFSPWYDSASNTSYGFAAYNGAPCGSCYALQFTGEGQYGATAGSSSLKGKQMIVQVINIGGLGGNQFDLLIPGGGVGDFAQGCQTQLSGANLGNTSGGMLSKCNQDVACTRTMCNAAFAGKTDLLNGCLWFTDCFQGADNPKFVYSKVTCPSQLSSRSKISG